ncbi:MAG: alpha-D-ribose 1-methylphosphonate 5-triphosphate diphosphatase [Pseudomonadota bacterium]
MRPAPERTLANAEIVLEETVMRGRVTIAGGTIVDIVEGGHVPPGAEDCGGQFLMPGLIELHTDNLERHLMPRPGVTWPGQAAVLAHDGEVTAAGITTVFDAVRCGSMRQTSSGGKDYARYARGIVDDIKTLRRLGLTRADHRIHLRAEVCSETVVEELAEFDGEDGVAIVSIMDHTPGQRQFADIAKFRQYHQGKYRISDAEMDAHIVFTQGLYEQYGAEHETGIVGHARRLGAVLASHDDTTPAHVARSVALSVDFAEFPTTLQAAEAYREHGVPVMMGAPNVLRGGSHSGNVSAGLLAERGLLDVLSSDYAPSSLLMGVMRVAEITGDLPGAVRLATAGPAVATGLTDRGTIRVGLRADMLRVLRHGETAAISGVWAEGRQVG